MALNFPNTPTDGQVYTDTNSGNRWVWDSANTVWKSTSTFTQTITVSSSQPGSPVVGQLWWNQDYGRLFIYYNDGTSNQWVDATLSPDISGIYGVANAANLVASSSFAKANTALQNTTGTFAGTLTVAGNIGLNTANPQSNVAIVSNTSTAYVTADATYYSTPYPHELTLQNNQLNTQNTFTGIFFQAGQTAWQSGINAGRLSFVRDGNNSYGGNFTFSNRLSTTANMREVMRIDQGGRITMPYQPFVSATKSNGTGWANYYNGGVGLPFIFNVAAVNNGSHYNTSTGIFTCPIAGYYKVNASILLGNVATQAGYFYLYKNGSQYGSTAYAFGGSGAASIQTTMDWIVYCAANDQLKIQAAGGNAATIYDLGYNALTIALVG